MISAQFAQQSTNINNINDGIFVFLSGLSIYVNLLKTPGANYAILGCNISGKSHFAIAICKGIAISKHLQEMTSGVKLDGKI